MNNPDNSGIKKHKDKEDINKFPVREGQGKDSSIRSENNRASGEDSGNSESYPEPSRR